MNPESPVEDELDRMRRLYGAESSKDCLALAERLWARHGAQANACLGECWRFAMIAAVKLNRPSEAVVWRSRARSAFARTGCQNGTALAMLPDFFMAIDRFPTAPGIALAVLDAIAATIGGSNDPISSDMALGIVLEKRGFLRAKIGAADGDRDLLSAARSDYDEALSVTEDLRRQLKIRAGRATVEYLLGITAVEKTAATVELREVLDAADSAGSAAAEVLRVGKANLEKMVAGRTDLEPYEVL